MYRDRQTANECELGVVDDFRTFGWVYPRLVYQKSTGFLQSN